MNTKQLLDLAARCEREGPSFELECAIEQAIQSPGCVIHTSDGWLINRHGTPMTPQWERLKPPRYTSSLDAAATLVSEGVEWNLTNLYGVARAEVGLNFSDISWESAARPDGNLVMALASAALKARAAVEGT